MIRSGGRSFWPFIRRGQGGLIYSPTKTICTQCRLSRYPKRNRDVKRTDEYTAGSQQRAPDNKNSSRIEIAEGMVDVLVMSYLGPTDPDSTHSPGQK